MEVELIKRIISAAVALPIVFWIISQHNPIFLPLALCFISILLAYETTSFSRDNVDKRHLFVITMLLLSLYVVKYLFLIDAITELACHQFIFFLILLSIVLPAGIEIFKHSFEHSIKKIGLSSLAFIFFGVVFSHAIELRFFHLYRGGEVSNNIGIIYLVYVFIIAWMSDTGGYFIGKFFGRKKIGLSVSPNKSWAGLIGGLFFALTGYLLCYGVFKNVLSESFLSTIFYANPLLGGFISIILAIFSQIGDLIESVFKRGARVENSSELIAGHGGVFDTIDSVIPTICLFFYLLLCL